VLSIHQGGSEVKVSLCLVNTLPLRSRDCCVLCWC